MSAQPVILVTTDPPYGDINSIYMDPVDPEERPVKVAPAKKPADAPHDRRRSRSDVRCRSILIRFGSVGLG